jgi:hypothetical protein
MLGKYSITKLYSEPPTYNYIQALSTYRLQKKDFHDFHLFFLLCHHQNHHSHFIEMGYPVLLKHPSKIRIYVTNLSCIHEYLKIDILGLRMWFSGTYLAYVRPWVQPHRKEGKKGKERERRKGRGGK